MVFDSLIHADRYACLHPHFAAAFFLAHGLLVKKISAELEEAGGSMQDYDLLYTLYTAPEGRLRLNELADAVVLSRSGLTRRVDRLAQEGMVERLECPQDRRGSFAILTAAGRQRVDAMWEDYAESVDKHFASLLSAEETRVLTGAFNRMLEHLQGHTDCPSRRHETSDKDVPDTR